MTTPSGRFLPNQPICIAGITNFHQEDWSPVWTVGAIAVGVQSFFYDRDNAAGVVMGVGVEEKWRLAGTSLAWNVRHVPGFREKFADLLARREERGETGEGGVGGVTQEGEEELSAGRALKVARQGRTVDAGRDAVSQGDLAAYKAADFARKAKDPVKESTQQPAQVKPRASARSGAEAVVSYFKLLSDMQDDDVLALASRQSGCPGISGYADVDEGGYLYFHELDEGRVRDLLFTIDKPSNMSSVVDLTMESQEEDVDAVHRRERDGAPHWRLQRVISRATLLGGVDWILKELKLAQQRKKEETGGGGGVSPAPSPALFFASKVLPRLPKVDGAAVRVLAGIYGMRVRRKHDVLTIISRGAGAPLTRAQERARFQFFERELGVLENLRDDLRWLDPQREAGA